VINLGIYIVPNSQGIRSQDVEQRAEVVADTCDNVAQIVVLILISCIFLQRFNFVKRFFRKLAARQTYTGLSKGTCSLLPS